MPAGRPTIYDQDKAVIFCELVANGATSVDAAIKAGIAYKSVYDWEESNEEFSEMIARARRLWAASKAEECLRVAEEEPRMIRGEDGAERVDPGWVQHVNSRLNYTRWLMGKRDPLRFGDQADKSTTVNVGVGVQVGLTEEQRQQIMERRKAALEDGQSPAQ